eukprot:1144232-Pelagomonas_calceolata.AAC.3
MPVALQVCHVASPAFPPFPAFAASPCWQARTTEGILCRKGGCLVAARSTKDQSRQCASPSLAGKGSRAPRIRNHCRSSCCPQ